jgi:hypothetical protein
VEFVIKLLPLEARYEWLPHKLVFEAYGGHNMLLSVVEKEFKDKNKIFVLKKEI